MDPNGATLPRFATGESGDRRPRSGWTAIAAAVAVLATAALATRSVRRVVVEGESMAPTLVHGDRLVVLTRPWGPPARLAVGDIVAVADPRRPDRVLVKRLARVDRAAGTVDVLGDASDASTDSRDFGPVPSSSVVGRVVHRYGPPGRSGPVPRSTEYHQA